MKQLLTLAIVVVAALAVRADYSYMLFKSTTGDTHSIAVAGLEITFSQDKLTASNSETSISIPLAQVASMEFSNEGSAGVGSIAADKGCEPVAIYTLTGVKYGEYASVMEAMQNMSAGVYILKYNDGTSIKISKK